MSQQPLVLVVDDFQDNREMYAEFLAYQGFRVIQAANGVEALDQALGDRSGIARLCVRAQVRTFANPL